MGHTIPQNTTDKVSIPTVPMLSAVSWQLICVARWRIVDPPIHRLYIHIHARLPRPYAYAVLVHLYDMSAPYSEPILSTGPGNTLTITCRLLPKEQAYFGACTERPFKPRIVHSAGYAEASVNAVRYSKVTRQKGGRVGQKTRQVTRPRVRLIPILMTVPRYSRDPGGGQASVKSSSAD